MRFAELLDQLKDEHLKFIAALDYGQDTDKHFDALKKVLLKQDGLIAEDQIWYPYEVIELGALALKRGHEFEFTLCNCIVARNVAAGLDRATDVVFQIDSHAEQIDHLPAAYRDLVLTEFVKADSDSR